jgi:sporulation protein YlmC with PRC-barrel domain
MATVSLSELLGSTVYDASGAASGRVREVALAPQEDRSRVALLIVKTPAGNRCPALDGGFRDQWRHSRLHGGRGMDRSRWLRRAPACSVAICSISR